MREGNFSCRGCVRQSAAMWLCQCPRKPCWRNHRLSSAARHERQQTWASAAPSGASAAHGGAKRERQAPSGRQNAVSSAAPTGLAAIIILPDRGLRLPLRGCAHPRLLSSAAAPLNCRCLNPTRIMQALALPQMATSSHRGNSNYLPT